MDLITQTHFENLEAKDKDLQYEAFGYINDATKEKVDWAYEVWGQLKEWLTDPNNHRRSRGAQFLANLAISDPEKRMLEDFSAVWQVTKDPKFVTARHSLQSIWRVALAGQEQREMVLKSFVDRFENGTEEKNYTLIRFDIIQGLRNLYEETKDEKVKQTALNLIEKEVDPKYKKKYASVWKKA